MLKVCAVVVTYNRKELLLECLDAILKQTSSIDKLLVIDNNSTDGTEDTLREKQYLGKKVIQYVKLPENIGGAGGFCEGIRRAKDYNPDWSGLWTMIQFPQKIVWKSC